MDSQKASDSGLENFLGGLIAVAFGGWFVVTQVLSPLFYLAVETLKAIGVLMVKLFHFFISALPYLHGLITVVLVFAWWLAREEFARHWKTIIDLTSRANRLEQENGLLETSLGNLRSDVERKAAKQWMAFNAQKRDFDLLLRIPDIRRALDDLKSEEAAARAVAAATKPEVMV
jgi:hypothetical protein